MMTLDNLNPQKMPRRPAKPGWESVESVLPPAPDRSFIDETLTVLEDLSINIETRTSELSTRQLALDQREAHLTLAETAMETRREQLDQRQARLAKRELAILTDLEKAAEAVEHAQRGPHSGSEPESSSPTTDILEKLASLQHAVDSTSRDNRRLTISVRDLIASNKQLRQQLAAQQDTIRTQSQQLDAAKRDLRQTRAQLKLAKSVSSAPVKRSEVGTAVAAEGTEGGGPTDQVIRLRAQLARATTQAAQTQLLVHGLESELHAARSQLASARMDHGRKQQEKQQLIDLLVHVMSGCGQLPPFPTSHSHLLSPTILAAIARSLVLSNTPVNDSTWRSALTHALTAAPQPSNDDPPTPLPPTALVSLSTALLTHLPSFNAHGITEAIDTLLLVCTDPPTPPLDYTSLTLMFHTLTRLLVPGANDSTISSPSSPVREKAACALLSLVTHTSLPITAHLPRDFDAIASLVLADLIEHGIMYKVSPTSLGGGSAAAVPGLVPVFDAEYSLVPAHACLCVVLKMADEEGAGLAKVGVQVRAVAGLIEEVVGMGDQDGDERVSGLRDKVRHVWNVIETAPAKWLDVGM